MLSDEESEKIQHAGSDDFKDVVDRTLMDLGKNEKDENSESIEMILFCVVIEDSVEAKEYEKKEQSQLEMKPWQIRMLNRSLVFLKGNC